MGKKLEKAHNALYDAIGLRDVLYKLKESQKEDQIPSLRCIVNEEATKPLYDE
jgi:DNA polymerase III alpha subunit (gram-positive type)